MTFFEKLKTKAAELAQAGMEKSVELAQTGVAKSKVLAEIAKLKAANVSEKETIRKAYQELGRIYYAEKGSTPDAAYAASCARVTDAMEAIRANNEKIEALKDGEDEVAAAAEEAIVLDSDDFEVEADTEEVTEAAPQQEESVL